MRGIGRAKNRESEHGAISRFSFEKFYRRRAWSGYGCKSAARLTRWASVLMVESRCGAVSVGRTYLFPPLSSGGALVVRPWHRFHIPLIEPDRRLSRIRLSDKTSRLRPRHVAPERGQAYEPVVPVKMREWIGPALASPDLVLDAQPPA